MDSLWQLGDEFRGQSKVSEDHQWSVITSKLAEMTRSKGERINNFDYSRNIVETKSWDKLNFQEDSNFENLSLGMFNLDLKMNESATKSSFRNNVCNMNSMHHKSNVNNVNFKMNNGISKYANIITNRDTNSNSNSINTSNNVNTINGNNNNNSNCVVDKRFKTLPSTEMLPRNEILGGYIFVCNNDTMQEDLKRQLFGPCYGNRCITMLIPRKRFIKYLMMIIVFANDILRACLRDTGTLFGQLLQDYLFSSTITQLISFMEFLRQQVLGVLTLIQVPGKIKNAKESLGFLHRLGFVLGSCASPLKKMHLGLFCTIMMAPNFALNSPLQRLWPC